jgi:hypothetical protein
MPTLNSTFLLLNKSVSHSNKLTHSVFYLRLFIKLLTFIAILTFALPACQDQAAIKLIENTPALRQNHQSKSGTVLALDGTGSGKFPSGEYTIERLTISQVNEVIDQIARTGGGILFLIYIDRDHRNNLPMKIVVPALWHEALPELRQAYFAEADYNEEKKQYATLLKKHTADSLAGITEFEEFRAGQRQKITDFITLAYQERVKSMDFSDVTGCVNNAGDLLQSAEVVSFKYKRMILVSDLQHDLNPKLKKEYNPQLKDIPADVEIYQINSTPSDSIDLKSKWFPLLDRNTIETIFNTQKN